MCESMPIKLTSTMQNVANIYTNNYTCVPLFGTDTNKFESLRMFLVTLYFSDYADYYLSAHSVPVFTVFFLLHVFSFN